jgi:hypothetical protein
VYVAPPPVEVRDEDEPGYHLHDGFYLRLALGAGWATTRIESTVVGSSELRVKGAGTAIDILLGGTPMDGLVLGGGISAFSSEDPRVETGGSGKQLAGKASLTMIGPFVDVFFDPRGGLHAGALLGLSTFNTEPDDPDSTIDEKPYNGAGVAAFTGYDAWISPNWSLGGTLRLSASSGKREREIGGGNIEERANAFGFALSVSALHH